MKDDSDVALDETIAPSSGETALDSAIDTERRGDLVAADVQLALVDPARYSITGEIGRGGLGRIMRARDKHLGRHVAIKELLHDDAEMQARFAREALVTARLMHPAIVPVYDAGTWPTGLPFYAMKMVSGRSLDEVIRATPKHLSLLPNVIAVTEAIAYAHSEGIIHRDLKPANVLVGSFGETVVIDWGLAKDLRGPEEKPASIERVRGNETVVGSVMGTPAYMPPEQAAGEAVDARADVYAIGALLYHVLAGVPPYSGGNADFVLARVLAVPPKPLPDDVPPELATIVGKAMARDPIDRYPSAAELAEDLKRFQTGGLVAAHAYTVRALVRRWIGRNRAVVAVGAIALALLFVGGGYALHRIYIERDAAIERADDAAIAEARAELEKDPSAAIAALGRVSTTTPTVRAIAAEAATNGIASRELRLGERAGVVAIRENGEAIVYDRQAIYRWNSRTGEHAQLAAMPKNGSELQMSPDGSTIAVMIEDDPKRADEGVQLIDATTGALRPFLRASQVEAMTFSRDSKTLAFAAGRTLSLIALADGARTDVPLETSHVGDFTQLEISRDGTFLMLSTTRDVTRCELATPPTCAIIPEIESDSPSDHHSLTTALSANGAQFYSAGMKHIAAYDFATKEIIYQYREIDSELGHLAFSPDGKTFVGVTSGNSLFEGGVLYLNDTAGARYVRWQSIAQLGPMEISDERVTIGTSIGVLVMNTRTMEKRWLRGQRDAVTTVATRGSLVASASRDGTVRMWDVQFAPLPCGLVDLHGAAISVDRKIAIAPAGERFTVCDVATLTSRAVTPSLSLGTWKIAAISPDDRRAVITSSDDTFVVDLATGETRNLAKRTFGNLAWGTEGITAINPERLQQWSNDLVPGRNEMFSTENMRSHMLSPDGRHYVHGNNAGADLVETATGASSSLDQDWTFVFSNDGARLASTSRVGDLHVRTLATNAMQTFPEKAGRITQLAWSTDGSTIATVNDTELLLWDLATGKSRIALRSGNGLGVRSMAFGPDGRHIAALTRDGVTHLIDTATLASRQLGALDDRASTVSFSLDSKAVTTSSERTRTYATWRDDLPDDPAALRAWLAASTMISEAP